MEHAAWHYRAPTHRGLLRYTWFRKQEEVGDPAETFAG